MTKSPGGRPVRAHICYCLWTNLYVATLLGGEFDNCHGQGPTPEEAMLSLQLTVRVRRKIKAGLDTYDNIPVPVEDAGITLAQEQNYAAHNQKLPHQPEPG